MATMQAGAIRQRIEDASRAGLGAADYTGVLLDLLRRAVPFDSACAATTDPVTGLMTGTVKVDLPDAQDRTFAHFEYEVPDINHYREVAQRPEPVGVLHHDTDGHPERSTRWREFLVPVFGHHHELRAAFRADDQPWGMLGLYRCGDSSGFSPAEAEFVAALSQTIGQGLRSALVATAVEQANAAPQGPAVLIIGGDAGIRSATPAARDLLAALRDGDGEELPASLHVLVSAARAYRAGQQSVSPRVRVRTPAGRWLVLHAAPLSGADADIAITIEPAGPPDVVPLVVAALGLTGREQEVAGLVLAGCTTTDIGRRLFLSPYTVQDHLKSIFAKAGVRSRRELLARVFFEQYAPRLGDPVGPSGWFAD